MPVGCGFASFAIRFIWESEVRRSSGVTPERHDSVMINTSVDCDDPFRLHWEPFGYSHPCRTSRRRQPALAFSVIRFGLLVFHRFSSRVPQLPPLCSPAGRLVLVIGFVPVEVVHCEVRLAGQFIAAASGQNPVTGSRMWRLAVTIFRGFLHELLVCRIVGRVCITRRRSQRRWRWRLVIVVCRHKVNRGFAAWLSSAR